jgi:hypothetical protein
MLAVNNYSRLYPTVAYLILKPTCTILAAIRNRFADLILVLQAYMQYLTVQCHTHNVLVIAFGITAAAALFRAQSWPCLSSDAVAHL